LEREEKEKKLVQQHDFGTGVVAYAEAGKVGTGFVKGCVIWTGHGSS
jgi:hypothetical protein